MTFLKKIEEGACGKTASGNLQYKEKLTIKCYYLTLALTLMSCDICFGFVSFAKLKHFMKEA